jgi:small subunit ribosomal protein S11
LHQDAKSSYKTMEDNKTTNESETEEQSVRDIEPIKEEKNSNRQADSIELPEELKKKIEKSKADKKAKAGKKKKKKEFVKVPVGKAFVKATYNNTIVTLTDTNGNVLSWASAGAAGFKGPKKSTPYAAQIITKMACEKAKEYGLTEVSVFVKGVGTGRESAVRALNANGLNVTLIKDITPIPHNGCRSKKPRRV